MNVSVGIIGLGKAVPNQVLTNADLTKLVDTSDEWITSRTGIKQRFIANPSTTTADLGYQAALQALESARLDAKDLDLIIVATTTPDMPFPATACLIQDKLKAYNAAAFDLAAACSGFVYGLEVGNKLAQTGYNRVLVVGVDVMSRLVDYSDRSTCVLFGDGAGAVILGPVSRGYGFLATELGADGSGADYLSVPDGRISMSGRDVFRFAVNIMSATTQSVLDKAGVSIRDIRWFIPHQANIRIIHAAAQKLNIAKERIFINVDRYGNTSAASIPIALAELVDASLVDAGDLLVLVGFGAGLTWGSAVLRWGGEQK